MVMDIKLEKIDNTINELYKSETGKYPEVVAYKMHSYLDKIIIVIASEPEIRKSMRDAIKLIFDKIRLDCGVEELKYIETLEFRKVNEYVIQDVMSVKAFGQSEYFNYKAEDRDEFVKLYVSNKYKN